MHKFEAITEQMTYFPKLIKQQYVGEADKPNFVAN